jgi:hypothetical protein
MNTSGLRKGVSQNNSNKLDEPLMNDLRFQPGFQVTSQES